MSQCARYLLTEPSSDHESLRVPNWTERVPEYEPYIRRNPNVSSAVHLADRGN